MSSRSVSTLALTALSSLLLGGCMMSTTLSGSGTLVSLEEDLSGFNRIDVGHAFEVEVRMGSSFSVVLKTDDNVQEHLDVSVKGDTLELDLKGHSYSFENVTLRAEVTLPELRGIDLSGASRAILEGISTSSDFELDLSGASSLSGDLRAADVDADLSGASRLDLTGGCDALVLDLSGASSAGLLAFEARDVEVDASGASHAALHARTVLSVKASGASRVTVAGNPTIRDIDTSGAAHFSTTNGHEDGKSDERDV